MDEKIEEFSNDASSLLNGQPIFTDIENVKRDVVYDSLFGKYDEFDSLTLEALSAIFKQVSPMLKRQLVDQLPGGKYYIPNDQLINECISVPKTNRIAEADFSALDRLDREAPPKKYSCQSWFDQLL